MFKLKKERPIPPTKLVFGGFLENHCRSQNGSFRLPDVVAKCVSVVAKRGLQSVGIYRLSGNSVTIQKLKQAFNNGIIGL